jgi:hypothetical protein
VLVVRKTGISRWFPVARFLSLDSGMVILLCINLSHTPATGNRNPGTILVASFRLPDPGHFDTRTSHSTRYKFRHSTAACGNRNRELEINPKLFATRALPETGTREPESILVAGFRSPGTGNWNPGTGNRVRNGHSTLYAPCRPRWPPEPGNWKQVFPSFGTVKKLLLILAIAVLASCASQKHKPHKKLKPGKPIPCPMKDC